MSTETTPKRLRGHVLRNVVLSALAAGAAYLLTLGVPWALEHQDRGKAERDLRRIGRTLA